LFRWLFNIKISNPAGVTETGGEEIGIKIKPDYYKAPRRYQEKGKSYKKYLSLT